LRDAGRLGELVGSTRPMQEIMRLVEWAAPSPAPVLITGETGTGKEIVARTLHQLSPRAGRPFVAINCSAIPETLMESEIFGHEKGAFTGAAERRIGCFELADGGTLLLDEIGEMPAPTQAKLLRVLEDHKVRRLGSKTETPVDVRVLAATNKDPQKALRDGSFREDLYYRLNVVSLALPPLREHREDIPLLIEAFIAEFNAKYDKRIGGVDAAAETALQAAPWPGNVRELRNSLERAVIVCSEQRIGLEHLSELPARGGPDTVSGPPHGAPAQALPAGSESPLAVPIGTSLEEAEKQLILRTLASQDNNKTRAAQVLGISLKTLHNKLKVYGA
jgi:DNA-binding NtrC family response regulator